MPGMKIKKGDTVQVVTGKDRGLRGKVIRASRRKTRWWWRAPTG